MTDRERRGGPRVPDGVPRPTAIPFAPGPNRSDLSALPGSPGTPLPPNPAEPQIAFGQVGGFKRALESIPLEALTPQAGGFMGPSRAPQEAVTAGVDLGAGPGAGALIPSPLDLSNRLAAQELRYAYPVIMRLATMPGATTQSKILAQRLRANLGVQPQQVPLFPGEQFGAVGETNRGGEGRG